MEEIILTTEEIEQIRHEAYIQGIKDNQGKREKVKEYLDNNKDKKESDKELFNLYGNFFFDFYKRIENKISPQYLVRTLYLCTYMDYDNRLILRESKHEMKVAMHECDLEKVWNISRSETYRTKTALLEMNILTSDEDGLKINPYYFKKGEIIKKNKSDKIRVFNTAIREIYRKSTIKEHKKLALLFELLPMINFEHNVVCKNPDEDIYLNIKPYTMRELCTILGKSNITYFKKELLNLTVNNELVCCIEETKKAQFITINPRVYYKGGKLNNIKYLENIFLISNKK